MKAFTDGYFALGSTGSDEGNGTRYFDTHKDKVWFGPEGARQACAYYIGGALGTAEATGRLLPDDDAEYLMRVQAAYMEGSRRRKADMENWESVGRERARTHAEVTS
ncbi:hypothetical protein ACFW2V_13465 [Streptomyces sp. NPDC058947]|uniref:hypothetical protein n=1 Tax=Streptomyces sp. NPDC058947 TaxID=3346675 RepID=UPI0036B04355